MQEEADRIIGSPDKRAAKSSAIAWNHAMTSEHAVLRRQGTLDKLEQEAAVAMQTRQGRSYALRISPIEWDWRNGRQVTGLQAQVENGLTYHNATLI
jgi:hypothetical protein